jgi:hypothetical protein
MGRIMRSTFGGRGAAVVLLRPASAQTDGDGALMIELNRVDQIGASCRFTFLADEQPRRGCPRFTLETVIIDAEGVVDRLTLFEFGVLPDGHPRVRQFDVPSLACTDVARILINGVSECGGVDHCAAADRSRTAPMWSFWVAAWAKI